MPTNRKNEPGGRSLMLTIRVSEQEKKAIQVKANSMSMTVSRLLVEGALKTDDGAQAHIWRTELNGLRRQVNETGCTPELDAKILDLLRRIDG